MLFKPAIFLAQFGGVTTNLGTLNIFIKAVNWRNFIKNLYTLSASD